MVLALGAVRVLAVAATPDPATWHFDVTLEAATERLELAACSDAAQTRVRFESSVEDATRHRLSARRASDLTLEADGNTLVADDWQAGECLFTRIDLGAAARAQRPALGYRKGSAFVLDPGRWLWRPARLHPDSTIAFTLPPGWAVSVPWSRLPDKSHRYRLGPTPADWSALTAFGRFEEQDLVLAGGVLRVTLLPPWSARDMPRIVPIARALTQAYGQLPLRDAQVVLLPMPGQRDAAPWGQVTRGGGSAVHLFAGAEADVAALSEDWTATHEFSHLLHPYLGDAGRWLGEGLASYYQNVLRARSGALDAEAAWERIEAGFKRGATENRSPGLSLAQASRRMGSLRCYMRVYWSGAAFWLDADLALRARGSSLDAVLKRHAGCCLGDATRVPLAEFIATLDRLSDSDVFSSRFRIYAESEAFPDLGGLRRRMQAQRADMAAIMRPR